jgi:hypothetical protein
MIGAILFQILTELSGMDRTRQHCHIHNNSRHAQHHIFCRGIDLMSYFMG